MKFSRQVFVVSVSLLCCAQFFALKFLLPTRLGRRLLLRTQPRPLPVLPTDFGGWQLKGEVARSDDPAAADAAECSGSERVRLRALGEG